MVADDCRGVEAMLCGVDVSANDVGSIGLDGGRQVAWAVDLAEARLSLAAARMLAQTGTQLGVGDWGWLAAESLHMQHAGANARRAGVGLRHVAGETALWTGGGRGCGEYRGDDGDDGGVEVLRGCCAVPCCAVLCCAAGSGERARLLDSARGTGGLCRGRRGVAAAGPGCGGAGSR